MKRTRCRHLTNDRLGDPTKCMISYHVTDILGLFRCLTSSTESEWKRTSQGISSYGGSGYIKRGI